MVILIVLIFSVIDPSNSLSTYGFHIKSHYDSSILGIYWFSLSSNGFKSEWEKIGLDQNVHVSHNTLLFFENGWGEVEIVLILNPVLITA
ncbi:hypothetical protein [Algoriphagus litoralis]|uniref:hypothetical protein n=1 Tax=Algoriphagus litoralis TaxID=2202829 RepID=UPI000DB9720F|nr:hypothetical protein [Algoriphagus litoralis]